MNGNKGISGKRENNRKLKNYSEVSSLNRLSDKDSQVTSSLIAGGDNSLIHEDTK